ncbi:type II toxin-antitoxin system RelB/DinJ family antitoxin [candidate division KSB1 bacterium]|nr:type II toxin-antitoxin system RelB/DinJ family antitoxin [candidate division KSB1 bacterium]
MQKSAVIHASINPKLKAEAEVIFEKLGLSISEAITLFYQQVKLAKGLPFEIRVPNKTTRKTFEETDEGKGVVRCKDEAELFKALGI